MTAFVWIECNTGNRNNPGLTALRREFGIADNQLFKIRSKVIKGQEAEFARYGLNCQRRQNFRWATDLARILIIEPQPIDFKFRPQAIPGDAHIIHRDRNTQAGSDDLF